jgi:hypothetical protein
MKLKYKNSNKTPFIIFIDIILLTCGGTLRVKVPHGLLWQVSRLCSKPDYEA